MKKIIFILLTVCIFIIAGCSNMGEPDPLFKVGLIDTEKSPQKVVLFANGNFYNFDYTYQYDGIQLVGYSNKKPNPSNKNEIVGNIYTKIGYKDIGVTGGDGIAIGTVSSIPSDVSPYETVRSVYWGQGKGDRALLFMHEVPGNCDSEPFETWRITMFDDPPLYVNRDSQHFAGAVAYSNVTFFVRCVDKGLQADSRVKLTIYGSSGVQLGEGEFNFFNAESTLWYRFTVPINKSLALDSYERVRQWEISVARNAGRVYIDEVVLNP